MTRPEGGRLGCVLAMGLAVTAATLVGCGGDEGGTTPARSSAEATTRTPSAATTSPKPSSPSPTGTKVIAAGSEFGTMLYGADKQAIYVFQRDSKNRSNCYGECAAAWPPVYTKSRPRAGEGVEQSLLGTTRRRDGRLQVTYAGQPLYNYVNEGPGEVRCHNVNLNGGLWWVVAPSGKHRS